MSTDSCGRRRRVPAAGAGGVTLSAEGREVQHRLVSRLLSQLCSRVTCVSCRRWTRATRRDTPVRRAVHADDQLAIVVGRTKLTTFAAVDEIFLQSLGQRFEWKSLSFGDTRIFVQRNIGQAESCLYAETSSVRPTVSIQYRLLTDTQTDTGHWHSYLALAWCRRVVGIKLAPKKNRIDQKNVITYISNPYCDQISHPS